MFSIRLSEAKENRIIIYRDSFQNGLKLGVQTRGKLASRLHAIDRTLKSVRRFLAHFGSHACAGTERTHGNLEWPITWRAGSGQAFESFASKRSDRSHT